MDLRLPLRDRDDNRRSRARASDLGLSVQFAITHRFSPADLPQGPLIVACLLNGTTSVGGVSKGGTMFETTLEGLGFTTVHVFAPLHPELLLRRSTGLRPDMDFA